MIDRTKIERLSFKLCVDSICDPKKNEDQKIVVLKKFVQRHAKINHSRTYNKGYTRGLVVAQKILEDVKSEMHVISGKKKVGEEQNGERRKRKNKDLVE